MLEKLNLAGFENPAVLYLVPLVWIASFGLAWRSRAPLAARPRFVTALLRAIVATALLVTLAAPYARVPYHDPVRWIVVRDRSASRDASTEADDALIARLAALDDADASVVEIPFADDGASDTDASAPQRALGRAREAIRPDRRNRIVVLTDGRFSRHLLARDWPTLGATAADVYHASPGARGAPDPRARALRLPGRIDAGERFVVEARYATDRPVAGTVRVHGLGVEIPPQPLRLDGVTDAFVTLELGPLAAGDYTLRVDFACDDDREPRNNALVSRLTVGAAPRVLIVDDPARDGGPIKAALEAQGIVCTVAPDVAPGVLDGVRAVVLRNRESRPSAAALVSIRTFVDRGGGLVVFGGPSGDGLYGWAETPIDELLPLRPLPPPPPPTPEKPEEAEDPDPPEVPDRDPVVKKSDGPSSTIAMMLLIDASGSMKQKDRGDSIAAIAYAREAAIAAAEKLRPHDRIGVIGFNAEVATIVPIGPVGTRRTEIARRIASIRAGGGTAFLPPLRAAMQALADERARVKHVILLTDGSRLDHELNLEAKFEDLMGRMVDRKITVTAVAIGADAETPFLAKLVRWNGRERGLHAQVAPREIPEIFTLEVDALLTRIGDDKTDVPDVDPKSLPEVDATPTPDRTPPPDRPTDDGGQADPMPPKRDPIPVRRAQPHPLLAPAIDPLPPLHGVDRAEARQLAWIAAETDAGTPVITTGRFGLGHVAAFSFDGGGAWSPSWVEWPSFSSVVAETVRFVGRAAPTATRDERAGRVHAPELDRTGTDPFGIARLERVLDARPLPRLVRGPWPGEPGRTRDEPMPPYLLLLAPLLFAIEIGIRRLAS